MATKTTKQQQQNKARVRDFQARNQAHQDRLNRIRRDNVFAIILAVLAVAIVIAVQLWVNIPPAVDPDATEDPDNNASLNTGDVPDPALAENRVWSGELTIDTAALEIELFGADAPQAVSSFISLAESGYFDGTTCHRLTDYPTMKVLQCGDPSGNGTGGPEYRFGPIENAPEDDVYPAGTLAMARIGNDAHSMGSQFFIVLSDSSIPSDTAGGYTLFGQITAGLDDLIASVTDQGIVEDALDGKPVAPAVVQSVSVE